MATIITVHGTGATGPEEGQAWWQKGSPFEKHIRELVEGEDGKLDIQRLIWDGANSESSRRKAARVLCDLMTRLQNQRVKYCLVGHSHGGSIIATSLLMSAKRINQLSGMSHWITIGTPFVSLTKSFFLFSRLGVIGKSAYLPFLLYTLFIAVFVSDIVLFPLFGQQFDYTDALIIAAYALIPFAISYILMWIVNSRRFYLYSKKKIRRATEQFGALWISLCHRNDEAIEGLSALRRLRINFFDKAFAVPLISFGSLFIFPATLALFTFSDTLANYAFAHLYELIKYDTGIVKDDHLIGFGQDYLVNFQLLVRAFSSAIKDTNSVTRQYHIALFLFMGPFVTFAASLFITYMVGLAAGVISAVLGSALNKLTWQQIRRSALGGDITGETSVAANDRPAWISQAFMRLPDTLSDEITDLSNMAAGRSVAKFRVGLSRLAFSDEQDAKSIFFSEYLTWEELIHTSYFNVPRFRMLVAYSIANSEGFRPSAAFKSHPDYELVARWYEEIQPKKMDAIA